MADLPSKFAPIVRYDVSLFGAVVEMTSKDEIGNKFV